MKPENTLWENYELYKAFGDTVKMLASHVHIALWKFNFQKMITKIYHN